MAAPTLPFVSLEEYLRCSEYEPDADYIDDHIEERPIGELDHNRIQKRLLLLLSTIDAEIHFECIQEQRVRVSPTRFRIPDLCLVRAGILDEQVTTTPPLLCIEVLSPEDTMPRTLVRVRDFLAMGVPQVWIVDPARRTIHLCTDSITTQTEGILEVPKTPITLSIGDIFSALDKKFSK